MLTAHRRIHYVPIDISRWNFSQPQAVICLRSDTGVLVAVKPGRQFGQFVIGGVRCGLRPRLTVKPNLLLRTRGSMTHSVSLVPI